MILLALLSVGAVLQSSALPVTLSTTTPEHVERVNEQLPHGEAPVVKDASLKKSAVGPGWTVIPLPAFTFNRNEGSWLGGLTPIFRANEKGQVEDIYAPLYLHNALIGETFTFNYFGYRHDGTAQYHFVASHATKVEHTIDASYKNVAVRDGHFIVLAQANSGKSAFNRFYGFGNNAADQFETQYSMGDSNIVFAFGVNMSSALAIIARNRYRGVTIENGASKTLPQTLARFPDVPGIDGADIVGQGVLIQYDTRDNTLTPLEGTFASLLGEYDQNVKFSERNQWWRVTGEARQFYPHGDGRLVFVWHALIDTVVGQDENSAQEDVIEQDTGQVDDLGNPILQPLLSKRVVRRGVPFYERPTLGGETTLRGYGRGRFVSNTAWLINLEERINLFRRAIMGNVIEMELAPFLDIGRVGRNFVSQATFVRAQFNPGMGVRVLARPNIAGRLDVGWGRDGAAVFVGLDYPF